MLLPPRSLSVWLYLVFLVALGVKGVAGDEFLPPITPGATISALAVDPVANRLYAADATAGVIYVFDGTTHAVVDTLSTANPCQLLCVDPVRHRLLAVENNGGGAVFYAFDENGTRLTQRNEPAPISALACNSTTGESYVLLTALAEVEVYAVDFSRTSVPIIGSTTPTLLALNPATGAIYVGDSDASFGGLYRIDPISLVVTQDSIGAAVAALAVNPATDTVYVSVPTSSAVFACGGRLGTFTIINTGGAPGPMALNPAANRLYVADTGGAGVRVVDGVSAKVIDSLPTSVSAQTVAINTNTNKVYVLDSVNNRLDVIDGNTNTTTNQPLGGLASSCVVSPLANRVYLSYSNVPQIAVIDGTTLTGELIALGLSNDLTQISLDPLTERIFAAGASGVAMFDGLTNDGATILYNGGPNVTEIVADPPRNRVYAIGPNGAGNSYVRAINVDAPNVGFNTTIVGAVEAGSLCVDPSIGKAYILAKQASPGILVTVAGEFGFTEGSLLTTDPSFDPSLPIACVANPVTHKVHYTNGYTLFTFEPLHGSPYTAESRTLAANANGAPGNPHLIDLDPATNTLYVLAYGDGVTPGTLFAVPAAGAPATPIATDAGPVAVAFDAANALIYVANRGSVTVSVFNAKTNALVSTIPLPATHVPNGVAVDPTTGKVYVTTENGLVHVIKTGVLSAEGDTLAGPAGEIVINPRTGKVYVADPTGGGVRALQTYGRAPSGLVTFISHLFNDRTTLQSFSSSMLSTYSLFGPEAIPPRQVYYQLDSATGPWIVPPVNSGPGTGEVFFSELSTGFHTLYAFATDGQEAAAGYGPQASSPSTGPVNSYTFLIAPGSFSFPPGQVFARDTDGSVTVTVTRDFTAAASVDFKTRNATATAGTNFVATSGTLTFADSEFTKSITVPLIDQTGGNPVNFFEIDLSNASDGSIVAQNAHQHVFIIDAQSPDVTLSLREQLAPDFPPDSSASLSVFIDPPESGGQWRLFGETAWRDSGSLVTGLIGANFSIEYKQIAGFTAPALTTTPIPEGSAVVATGHYVGAGTVLTGSLQVTLAPSSFGGWRLQGDQTFNSSGTTLSGLVPGRYILEFETVVGRATPPKRIVEVLENQTVQLTATYFIAEPTEGSDPQEIFAGSAQFSAPGQFIGQIQTDSGMGTGFVPLDRVVATCAHVLFDDGTLSYVTGVRWFFQHDRDNFETPPQIPRGSYLFQGYAAQRAQDATPGESSTASRQLDVAAMFFFEPAGRGGASGYLASDAATNTWLTSASRRKLLAGYPVEGVLDGSVGRPFATPNFFTALTNVTGPLFRTTAAHGFPGMSGGALWVGFDDGTLYPAAVYLGGTQQTLVRAIDSQVIDLFNRAQVSGNGGANNVGGGITLVNNGLNGSSVVAYGSMRVTMGPAGANAAGARWRIMPQTAARRSDQPALGVPPGDYTIRFTAVSGYTTPPDQLIAVTPGLEVARQATYVPNLPPTITSATSVRGITGQPFSYRIAATFDPTDFTATGLPAGLVLNTSTGVIAGRPTVAGTFIIPLTAHNGSGTGNASLTLNVSAPGSLTIGITGQGSVPRGFGGTTVKAVGSLLTVRATPARNFLFESWTNAETGAVVSTTPIYQFSMPPRLALQANFAPNLFPPGKGTYLGLLRGGSRELSGLLKITVAPTGAFSAHLDLGGSSATIANVFGVRGGFQTLISLADLRSYQLALTLGTGGTITGTLTDVETSTTVPLIAARNNTRPPRALLGAYTARLTPGEQADGVPAGLGALRIVVGRTGGVSVTGTLGSGTPIAFASNLNAAGAWPFFANANGGNEILIGTLAPDTTAKPVFSATLDWFRTPGPDDEPYPAGYNTTAQLASSRFAPPAVRYTSAILTFNGGDLAAPVPLSLLIDRRGKAKAAGNPSGFTFTLQAATGLFSGTFSDGTNTNPFRGIIFQSDLTGAGSFTSGNGETGSAQLEGPPQ